MPLPWLIGIAVIAAGTAIYNAVKEEDKPTTSDNSSERAESARKAQKEKERLTKKIEIIEDTKETLTNLYTKHKDFIDVKNEVFDDNDKFFSKLKNTAKLTNSSNEPEILAYLSHLKFNTFLSEKQKNQDNKILLLENEVKTLDHFLFDIRK